MSFLLISMECSVDEWDLDLKTWFGGRKMKIGGIGKMEVGLSSQTHLFLCVCVKNH